MAKAVEAMKPVILDACCLLNLHAGGRFEDMIRQTGVQFLVEHYVLKSEAQSVWSGSESDAGPPVRDAVDPSGIHGFLGVVQIETESEAGSFLELATIGDLDDGEARTLALALHRGYAVATDEKKARSVLAARGSRTRLLSTPDLVYRWAYGNQIPKQDVQRVIRGIETVGRYIPSSREPHYKWWQSSR